MRKYKKTAHIKRLRGIQAEICRLRDKICQRCNRDHGKMDTSHIFPKGQYRSAQFLMENVKLLCYQCHRWWHENPIEATDWIQKYLGAEKYKLLHDTVKRTNHLVDRIFLDQTEIKLKELRDEYLAKN